MTLLLNLLPRISIKLASFWFLYTKAFQNANYERCDISQWFPICFEVHHFSCLSQHVLSSTAENLVNHIRENLSWWKGIHLLPLTQWRRWWWGQQSDIIISPIKFNFLFQSTKLEIMKKTANESNAWLVELSIESYYFTIWMSHLHSCMIGLHISYLWAVLIAWHDCHPDR